VTTRHCTCGNQVEYQMPARFEGSSLLIDIERCAVCPWCGQRLLLAFAVHRPRHAEPRATLTELPQRQIGVPLRASLRAIQGLLRLALNHIERVIEEHHDYSWH
jgi:hypothetical protein